MSTRRRHGTRRSTARRWGQRAAATAAITGIGVATVVLAPFASSQTPVPAAILSRGAAGHTTYTSDSTTTLTVAAPAGAQAGDVLVASLGFGKTGAASQPTLTAPGGRTLVSRTNQGTVGTLAVFTHTFAAGETSYSWTTNLTVGRVAVYRGLRQREHDNTGRRVGRHPDRHGLHHPHRTDPDHDPGRGPAGGRVLRLRQRRHRHELDAACGHDRDRRRHQRRQPLRRARHARTSHSRGHRAKDRHGLGQAGLRRRRADRARPQANPSHRLYLKRPGTGVGRRGDLHPDRNRRGIRHPGCLHRRPRSKRGVCDLGRGGELHRCRQS